MGTTRVLKARGFFPYMDGSLKWTPASAEGGFDFQKTYLECMSGPLSRQVVPAKRACECGPQGPSGEAIPPRAQSFLSLLGEN